MEISPQVMARLLNAKRPRDHSQAGYSMDEAQGFKESLTEHVTQLHQK